MIVLKCGKEHFIFVIFRVNDPHSHLLVQVLPSIIRRFDVEIELLIVDDSALAGFSTGEVNSEVWSYFDAKRLATLYKLETGHRLLGRADAQLVNAATRATLMVALLKERGEISTEEMLCRTIHIGSLLYSPEPSRESDAAIRLSQLPQVSPHHACTLLDANLKRKVPHWTGGLLTNPDTGEQFWGVDRCGFLERRLLGLGRARTRAVGVEFDLHERLKYVSLPKRIRIRQLDEKPKFIELFYSFRSPYSQLCLKRLFKLADHYGIEVVVRPVNSH